LISKPKVDSIQAPLKDSVGGKASSFAHFGSVVETLYSAPISTGC
jgi:hypothetical protein